MTFSDLALGAYAKLHAAFGTELDRPVAEHLGYEYPRPASIQPTGPLEFKYDLQESDFTRELVNAFNKYTYWLNRLALWEFYRHIRKTRHLSFGTNLPPSCWTTAFMRHTASKDGSYFARHSSATRGGLRVV